MSEEIIIVHDVDTKEKDGSFGATISYDDDYYMPFDCWEYGKTKEETIKQLKIKVQSFIKRLNNINWDKSIDIKDLRDKQDE